MSLRFKRVNFNFILKSFCFIYKKCFLLQGDEKSSQIFPAMYHKNVEALQTTEGESQSKTRRSNVGYSASSFTFENTLFTLVACLVGALVYFSLPLGECSFPYIPLLLLIRFFLLLLLVSFCSCKRRCRSQTQLLRDFRQTIEFTAIRKLLHLYRNHYCLTSFLKAVIFMTNFILYPFNLIFICEIYFFHSSFYYCNHAKT